MCAVVGAVLGIAQGKWFWFAPIVFIIVTLAFARLFKPLWNWITVRRRRASPLEYFAVLLAVGALVFCIFSCIEQSLAESISRAFFDMVSKGYAL